MYMSPYRPEGPQAVMLGLGVGLGHGLDTLGLGLKQF